MRKSILPFMKTGAIPIMLLACMLGAFKSGAQYCTPASTNNGAGDEILNVTFAGINNSTGAGGVSGYNDYTSTVAAASVMQGASYPASMMINDGGTEYGGIWIDWDQNQVFDASEFVSMGSGANPTVLNQTIVVPITAVPGTTHMRVRSRYNTALTGADACIGYGYGETEDYLVDVAAASACTGNPVAGTASAVSSVCPGTSFGLSLTGYTVASGITIQWEESPAGAGTFGAISGATNSTYTVSGISSDMDYRATVTCTNGGASDVSNTITVTVNSFLNCYCSSHATSTADEEILNVTLGGTLNNSSTCATAGPPPNSVASEYSDYTATVAAATVSQGDVVPFSVQVGTCGTGSYNNGVKIFIDFDQNGLFTDPGEEVYVSAASTSGAHIESGAITIPLTATTGTTKMRVVSQETGTPSGISPCGTYGYGETEDYLVDIVVPTPCSGNPVAGTATAPASICPNNPFTLSLSGYTSGQSGITIQWEESPAGASSWTAISGATTPFFTNAGISSDMDYHAIVTCTNGGGTDISNAVTVTVNPFYACYCTTNLGGATGNSIDSVSIAGTTLANATPGTATGYYTSYPATGNTTATLQQGVTYTINTIYSAGSISSLWIDYDHSGTFDASEWTQLTTTASSASVNITVPMTALTGPTGMRIRTRGTGNNNGATDACSNFGSGETEDYIITIDPATACSGTPTAGTASGPANACANAAFTVSVTGATVGTGISIQWESSPAGAGTFTAISGATDATYIASQTSATDYQAVITCANGGGSATTNIVSVGMNDFLSCYCVPTYANGGTGDNITNVTLGALNNGSTGNAAPHYTDYSSQQPASIAIPDIYPGGSADVSITTGTDGNQYNGVWIDFDQSGTFDASEFFSTGTNAGASSTAVVNVTVPATAVLGLTKMRIRAGDDVAMTSAQACGASNSSYGEAEDYLVNIVSAPACLPPTGLSTANVTATSADVSWNAVAGASGYEYAVTTSSTPPASGTPTTNTTESAGSLSGSTTYYLHVRTDCGGGSFSTWSTLSFQTLLSNDDASGAISITVGASCSGSPYFNNGATQSAGEPAPSCVGSTTGYQTVWYSFVAPASGAVKVSNDFAGGTMGTDTRMALFSATDPNDYTTFTMLSCDDDNGVIVGARSIIYGAGLTPGDTYYIEVDGYSSGTIGSFCLEVSELNNSMLASSGSCTAGNSVSNATGYSGWRSLVDNSGNLIANVRDISGLGAGYSVNVTKNTGAVRADGNLYYLDRNYKINLTSGTSTNFDVQFFFTDAELAALQAVDPSATLANLNATRQTGTTCQADFAAANGASSLLAQIGNGASNGADWITVNTPGFSNFYIMGGIVPLNIELRNISAINDGPRNRVDWTTGNEQKGDYFEIEKSADGHNFSKVGEVSANGKASSYSFWDQTPVAGVNYYRLKLMTASGASSYSKVVTATVKETGSFNVEAYPNPVSDQLTVSVYGQQGANASVSICDVTGKVLRVVSVSGSSVTVDMGSMAQGMYLIKYSDANHTQTIKVNKQ